MKESLGLLRSLSSLMANSLLTHTRSLPCPICHNNAPVIEVVNGARLGQFQLRDTPTPVSCFDAVVYQCQNCHHYFMSDGGEVNT